jgi:phage shock protein C
MNESRLRRSRRNRMVGGVIGGVAEYFDRDPTLLRVLYVLISIVSAAFPGIFVYLVLWVLIPEQPAESTAQAPSAAAAVPPPPR